MTKEYKCATCDGENTPERARKKRPCAKCAMDRYYESVVAMANKVGPMYEKWKRNCEAARAHGMRGSYAGSTTSID